MKVRMRIATRVALLLSLLLPSCAVRRQTAVDTMSGIGSRSGLASPTMPSPKEKSAWPPGLGPGSALTSDDAAAVALWNNKQLHADLETLGIAKGDLIDAGLLRNPRLDMLMPVGAKPFELLVNFPVEVFWQRGRRVQAAEHAFEQLGNSLIQNGLNAIRDARLAHADLVLALIRQDVAQRSVELRDRIAQLTEARLRAGDISELDAMAAKSDLASAKEQLARLSAESDVANERLRFALGLAPAPGPLSVKADPVATSAPPSASDLLERALASRADLKAAEISIAAATKRAGWERRRLSLVSAQLSSKGIGTNGILTSPGISAELPIFHRNQGLIARADADVEVQMRLYLALKQRVAFEVQEARQLLLQAQAGLSRLNAEVLPALRKTASLAQQQYEKGEVAYLFVLEQTRGLVDAELRLADSEAVVRRSLAQLERSVGSK